MSETVMQTHGLSKKYGEFHALDGVTLTLNQGDIYGLVGRNGAGKTTFFKCVMGLVKPSAGDIEIGGEKILKGTWVMTAEVTNADVWDSVQKGDLTGYSMGGHGKFSEEDVDLDKVEKTAAPDEDKSTDKKGIIKSLASLFGYDLIEKGAMMDTYVAEMKSKSFWTAFHTLEDMLYRYNWTTDRWEFKSDETEVEEALSDFSTIISDLLAGQNITKALAAASPVNKAGKKMSSANQKKLDAAYTALTELRTALADEGEETIEKEDTTNMDNKEMQELIEAGIQKALAPVLKALEGNAGSSSNDGGAGTPAPAGTEPEVQQKPDESSVTKEEISQMIDDGVSAAVAKALEPILKASGLASNLNGEKPIEKSDQHYLAGIL